jgi:uncharacterized surface protein with fasciclin (FAS1) repeats
MLLTAVVVILLTACSNQGGTTGETEGVAGGAGQSGVQDDVSMKDVVKVAVASPDHTTLVKAVQAADLVNALSNAGPFTVFAPTDKAFAALPAGTLDELLKPENQGKLADILYHHVTVSAYEESTLRNLSSVQLFDGSNAKVTLEGNTILIDGAKILGSVRASNGVVHVIDKVLVPGAN